MKLTKRITLRLSLEKTEDKAIADFLSKIDRTKYHTVNKAIKAILYEFISGTSSDKLEKLDTKNIISVIKSTLETEISKLFSVFVSDNNVKKPSDNKPVEEITNSSDDDIDISFIGG